MKIVRSIKQNNSQTGTTTPIGNVTPDFVGQTYINTTTNEIYISNGVTNISWILQPDTSSSDLYLYFNY